MRRTVPWLLLFVVVTIAAADPVWCPDDCGDSRATATDHDHTGGTAGRCLLCANGIHPGPQAPLLLVAELADSATPVPPPRLPMTPPRPIDHPPA